MTRPSRLAKQYARVSAALLLPSQPSRIELEHGDELTVTSEDEWKLCGMELGSVWALAHWTTLAELNEGIFV